MKENKTLPSVYIIGIMIFIIIIISFFITNIFFRNQNYYRTSISLSAFLLPIIFAAGAFFSVIIFSKKKIILNFKEAYGRAFMPMFIGGALSFSAIFIYINYVDIETKKLLNYQYIESFKTSLEEDYNKSANILKLDSEEWVELNKKYEEGKIRIKHKEDQNEDMFGLRYFVYIFAGYCIFFLILSLFFASFFRTRISELENNSSG